MLKDARIKIWHVIEIRALVMKNENVKCLLWLPEYKVTPFTIFSFQDSMHAECVYFVFEYRGSLSFLGDEL
jgi:hypothetical protein